MCVAAAGKSVGQRFNLSFKEEEEAFFKHV